MSKLFSIIKITLLGITLLSGRWLKTQVGGGSALGRASQLVITEGRNDDTNRLYVAGWNRLYEFTFRNNTWVPYDIGLTLGWGVCAGEGRNDGVKRIYATFTVTGPQYGGVYEYTWDGSSWQRATVATFPSSPHSSAGHAVALGPARNDGINRIYSCDGNNDRTFESYWNGTTWVINQILDWAGTDMLEMTVSIASISLGRELQSGNIPGMETNGSAKS